MRVELGTLARMGLETHLGDDLQAGVRIALAHYLAAVEEGEARTEVPRFDCGARQSGRRHSVEVNVDAASQAVLEDEANRQGISPDMLAAHSVYLYLAWLELV